MFNGKHFRDNSFVLCLPFVCTLLKCETEFQIVLKIRAKSLTCFVSFFIIKHTEFIKFK